MVNADMCKHEWPGSSCPDCRAEAEARAEAKAEARAKRKPNVVRGMMALRIPPFSNADARNTLNQVFRNRCQEVGAAGALHELQELLDELAHRSGFNGGGNAITRSSKRF